MGIIVALRTLRAIKRQADLMEGGLHVDGVRVIQFEKGKEPIFFVKIMNSGMAAKQVRISMKIDLDGSTAEYLRDQVMTIPGQDGRECFIRFAHILNTGDLSELEGASTLRVSGRIASGKEITEYCYKYNPWAFDNRPPELPLFVACDFDTGIAAGVVARPRGLSMIGSVGTVTASATNPGPDSPKASKEPADPN